MEIPNQNKWQPKKLGFFAGIILVLALIVVGIIYSSQPKTSNLTVPRRTYSQLKQYSVTSNDKSKAVLMAPTAFTQASLPGVTSAVRLEDRSQDQLIGLIVLTAATANLASSPDIKAYGQTIMHSNAKAYQSVIQPIIFMLDNQIGQGYQVSLGKATATSTANIKTNVWSWPFTAAAPNQKNRPEIQGSLLLAAGKTTFYYLMQSAAQPNWQSNNQIWQQVINSLKIDQ